MPNRLVRISLWTEVLQPGSTEVSAVVVPSSRHCGEYLNRANRTKSRSGFDFLVGLLAFNNSGCQASALKMFQHPQVITCFETVDVRAVFLRVE
jgi:hypothetical protein